MPKLLHELMATVSGSFVSRLNLATSEVVPETKALAKGKLQLLFRILYSRYFIFIFAYLRYVVIDMEFYILWDKCFI